MLVKRRDRLCIFSSQKLGQYFLMLQRPAFPTKYRIHSFGTTWFQLKIPLLNRTHKSLRFHKEAPNKARACNKVRLGHIGFAKIGENSKSTSNFAATHTVQTLRASVQYLSGACEVHSFHQIFWNSKSSRRAESILLIFTIFIYCCILQLKWQAQ